MTSTRGSTPSDVMQSEIAKNSSSEAPNVENAKVTAAEAPVTSSPTSDSPPPLIDPPSAGNVRQDGSVVSEMTDQNSIEAAHSMPVQTNKAIVDDVPRQLILSNNANEEHATTPLEEPLVVVTEMTTDAHSTVSMSAIPDPPSTLLSEPPKSPKVRSSSIEDTLELKNSLEDSANSTVDEYIRSPEVQNAIVERSPGGRYVRFMEKLGSGASKDVYRAYDTQEGIEVAWNVVNLSGVPKSERNRIVNEVRLLERLHHHNIISFHGSWVNRERQEVNFVTEILSSGTLKSFIQKVQFIRWKIAKRWAIQILKGLEYLHSQDPPVIHRDLKCENIFINGTSGDLRIGDLGLSTVHRNGRVLSVLGTPEFMAPDMYEDGSYDEKVDIYAFGMCMLEIFTKEIPYSECMNPAQIYKKVINGELPEVLNRLQSRHAREFVVLCLGYKDENGKYIRPSATELLQHPFLIKRNSDDDEVMVDPPIRERTIMEVPSESSPSSTPSVKQKRPSGTTSAHDTSAAQPVTSTTTEGAVQSNLAETVSPQKPHHVAKTSLSSLDDDGDQFEEMPQSETNMRKVKVMMGRGQEWKDIDTEEEKDQTRSETTGIVTDRPGGGETNLSSQTAPASLPPESSSSATESKHSSLHYLVAAAVIENEELNVRPYADDVLKLVVTLPVEGQTQNVQFDFHLVEDDPVQVAKEMVQELGIPQAAILEISETISGLARQARMKQDRYMLKMQNAQSHSQTGMQNAAQVHSAPATNQIKSHEGSQENVQQNLTNVSGASPVPEFSSGGSLHVQQQPQQHHHHVQDASFQMLQGQTFTSQHPQHFHTQDASMQQYQSPLMPPHQPIQYQASHSASQPTYLQPGAITFSQPNGQSEGHAHNQAHSYYPPGSVQPMYTNPPMTGGVQRTAPSPPSPVHHIQQLPRQTSSQGQMDENGLNSNEPIYLPPQLVHPSVSVTFAGTHDLPQSNVASHTEPSSEQGSNRQTLASDHNVSGTYDNSRPAQPNPDVSFADATTTTVADLGASKPSDRVLSHEDTGSIVDEDSDDEELNEELRKLEEDFQRNLQRARKVFLNRMENLQRSQEEREAQHQKTLEKHEKERTEFEKRLAQEEEQQLKRIEQLQQEWVRKRETLAQLKRKQQGEHFVNEQQYSDEIPHSHENGDVVPAERRGAVASRPVSQTFEERATSISSISDALKPTEDTARDAHTTK